MADSSILTSVGASLSGLGLPRVARSPAAAPATVAAPALVYPGSWRITAEIPGGATSSSLFELVNDGTARGCLLGRHDAASTVHARPAAFVGPCALFLLSPRGNRAQYNGYWAYHRGRRILTFDFTESVAGIPGMRSGAWQIELTGRRMGALFGRDRRMVSYTLEHEQAQPGRDAPPVRRAAAER